MKNLLPYGDVFDIIERFCEMDVCALGPAAQDILFFSFFQFFFFIRFIGFCNKRETDVKKDELPNIYTQYR